MGSVPAWLLTRIRQMADDVGTSIPVCARRPGRPSVDLVKHEVAVRLKN